MCEMIMPNLSNAATNDIDHTAHWNRQTLLAWNSTFQWNSKVPPETTGAQGHHRLIGAATTADPISLLAATRQSFLRKLAQILSPLAIRRRWLGQH